MIIWDGACHVHEEFSLKGILKLKKENPDAKLLSHPECKKNILNISDHIGSTSSIIKFSVSDNNKIYIVATESGIIHQMKIESPEKIFIPAPPIDSKNTCNCNECEYMRLHTLEKLYNCLKYELPEINLDEELRKKAEVPIRRMLEISKKLNI